MTPQLDPQPYSKPQPFTLEETTKPVALADVRAELVREIGMRRRVYPKWCHEGRNNMTREEGAQRIAGMESALRLFDGLISLAAAAQGLRDESVFAIAALRPGASVDKLARRVELVDAALAVFDRHKVEPPAHVAVSAEEMQRDFR